MIPFCKVFHIDNANNISNLSGRIISLTVDKGADATKNSCTIELQNIPGQVNITPEIKYSVGDLNNQNFVIDQSTIVIYLDWSPIPLDSNGFPTIDPIISAFVSSVDFPQDTSGKYKIKIKGTDKTGLFLSKIWAFDYTNSANKNAPEIIINLCGHLDGLSNNATKYINGTLTTNNVALTKKDGTAFPRPVNISKIWKPGYEWLNEISTPQYTGEDMTYTYFVDANNDLHWNYPYNKDPINLTSDMTMLDNIMYVSSTAAYPPIGNIFIDREVITYTGKTATSFTGLIRGQFFTQSAAHNKNSVIQGDVIWIGHDNVYSIDLGSTEDSVYNMIIYNWGKTPEGFDYLNYTIDPTQRGRSFRMKFFDWTSEGQAMTNGEKARKDVWTDNTQDFPQSYPYTPLWGGIVNNNNEYQASWKVEANKRATGKCKAYFLSGRQKYSATIQMRGTSQYVMNEMLNVYDAKFNVTKLLRIKGIKHQLNKGSWITTIDAETDPLPSQFTGGQGD